MPLIVIDGIDGTGKATQANLLLSELETRGENVRLLDFPAYDRGSCILAKQYLEGKFGSDPMALDPYLVSPFYSIDRVISYLTDWHTNYQTGDWLISNRYTTSNMIHQGSKLPEADRLSYFQWLENVEYDNFELPRPDMTFLLDLPFDVSDRLRKLRNRPDIHEEATVYLQVCRETALMAAEEYRWKVIDCSDGHDILDPEKIHENIMTEIDSELNGRSTSL